MDAVGTAAVAVSQLEPHQRIELAAQLIASTVEVDDTVDDSDVMEDVTDQASYLIGHPGAIYASLLRIKTRQLATRWNTNDYKEV